MADTISDIATLSELNAESKYLIDCVDKLRDLNIGEVANFPQIIVVGDQSSGKSSVLEAISRIRFTVKGDPCTRFATELILRKLPDVKINVKICPADRAATACEKDCTALPFEKISFDKNTLSEIVEEASRHMGTREGGIAGFSKDILHVEVSGPDLLPLTLVDLPGFSRAETSEQTQEEKEIVDQLVESYMKQNNSIILAVVSADNQLAGQNVLREAKKHDPNTERTLGIITKPDVLGAGTANQKKALELAQNREAANRLSLGWHVLKNCGEAESHINDERDKKEEIFFQTTQPRTWGALRQQDTGISSLRRKLSRLLKEHIKKNLPALTDIETNLRSRQAQLERLGRERSTPDELRSYLFDIASDFQRISRDALRGDYGDEFFGSLDLNAKKGEGDENALDGKAIRRLRAVVRNLNQAFTAVMFNKGASQEIIWDSESDSPNRKTASYDEVPPYLQRWMALYDFKNPDPISYADLRAHFDRLSAANQGRELPGSPNGDLAIEGFRFQMKSWKAIAERHAELVVHITKAFVDYLLKQIVGGQDVLEAILTDCVDPFFREKEEELEKKLEELLRPYKSEHAWSMDTEFRMRLSQKRDHRFADRIYSRIIHSSQDAEGNIKLTRGLLREAVRQPAFQGDSFNSEEVIDIMVTYYEMSLRTFTENVIVLAVESCLVSHIPNILTPKSVDGMSIDELKRLASESEDCRLDRLRLQFEIRSLQQGLEELRRHAPRTMTPLPAGFWSTPVNTPLKQITSHFSAASNLVLLEGKKEGNSNVPTTKPMDAASNSVSRAPKDTSGLSTQLPVSNGASPGLAPPSTNAFGSFPMKSNFFASQPPVSNTSSSPAPPNTGLFGSTRNTSIFASQSPVSNSASSNPAPPSTSLFAFSTKYTTASTIYSPVSSGTSSSLAPPSTSLFGSLDARSAPNPTHASPLFGNLSAQSQEKRLLLELIPDTKDASRRLTYHTEPELYNLAVRDQFMHLNAAKEYIGWSLEEIRLRDYIAHGTW